MKITFYRYFILLIGLISCNKSPNENRDKQSDVVAKYMRFASNNSHPVNERIEKIKLADSISIAYHLSNEHLSCIRLLGSIYLQEDQLDSSLKHFTIAHKLSTQLPDSESLSIVYNNLGLIYSDLSKYDTAIEYFTLAAELFDKLNNRKWLAECQINTGIAFEALGNYEEALKVNIEAAHLLDSLDDEDALASAYINIGSVMNQVGRHDEGLDYYGKALLIMQKIDDSDGMGYVVNNIGYVFQCKKDYLNALSKYNEALYIKYRVSSAPKVLAVTFNNIAEAYFGLKDYINAEKNFLKAQQLSSSCTDHDGFINTSNKLSKLYLDIGNVQKAKETALAVHGLDAANGLLQQRLENNMLLFEIFERERNYEMANEYAGRTIALKDSVFSKGMADAVVRMNTKYKTERKEKELAVSKYLQQNQSVQIKLQKASISLLVVLLVILAVAVFLILKSNRTIKNAKQQIELLMKELGHRVSNNLMLIIDMLYLQKKVAHEKKYIELIDASINRVQSIGVIHNLLHTGGFSGMVDINQFMRALAISLQSTFQFSDKNVSIKMNVDDARLNVDKAISLGLVINELLTNSYKYGTSSSGKKILTVDFYSEIEYYVLQIEDDCGHWDVDAARKAKAGLGLQIIEALIKQIKGNWEIFNNLKGTTHRITFSN